VDPVRWAEFVEADGELAAHVLARLQAAPCYLATVRKDGWPRIHPIGVAVRDGDLVIVMYPTSPKRHDLLRDGKYALHGVVEDNVGGGGEVLVTGVAVERPASEEDVSKGYVAFDFLIGEVQTVRYEGDDADPVRNRWKPV
jgi:hypothetical protein